MPSKQSFRKKFSSVFGAYHFLWAWNGARRHDNPSSRIFVIGITGTKGKTTTIELLNAILEAAGKETALLSSLRIKVGPTSQKNNLGNSMPGHGYIQKFLEHATQAKCGYALIEVTSQGVAMHRHRFIDWNIGVLTNLAPEHIESHGSFERYRKAKLDFLQYVLKRDGKVFLNRDDQHFPFFSEALAGDKTITYARTNEEIGDYLVDTTPGRRIVSDAAPAFLLSAFNQENVAAAIAIAKDLGVGDKTIRDALTSFGGVQGRMEFVSAGPYTAVVDYAHTPDSLEAVYRSLRERLDDEGQDGRLICVLGAAGGGRDAWKRPEMGKIAAHSCDEIVLTDEDPYDEKPEAILNEIASGISEVPYPRPNVSKIIDRREALAHAIDLMREGDIVIATGKGSEDWIHRAKGKKIPWNEKETLQQLLALKKNRPAP